MKERHDMIEDEEECLECKGGFLKQGLRAVEELKDKVWLQYDQCVYSSVLSGMDWIIVLNTFVVLNNL